MALTLLTIPCLSDNYAYLIGNDATGRAALIDAPEAAPIAAALDARGWTLEEVWLTHHHPDHIDGLAALPGQPRIHGARADAGRLPPLTDELAPGEGQLLGAPVRIIDVPGHTIGHLAFFLPEQNWLFSGDSLMIMGCGRLFEGTAQMMWQSLQALRALPGETLIASGHEYTQTNIAFALAQTPDHAPLQERAQSVANMRREGLPTMLAPLHIEVQTNPFLRADDPAMAEALGMAKATPLEVFTELRKRRDKW